MLINMLEYIEDKRKEVLAIYIELGVCKFYNFDKDIIQWLNEGHV